MNSVNSSKALKAGLWYIIANFISKGLIFLTTPIFTRILTQKEYGQYSNFANWQSLFLILFTLELYSTIKRAVYDYELELDQYISSITLLGIIFTGACYLVAIMFMGGFSRLIDIDPIYIHIMFVYLLTAPALQILQAKYQVNLKYKGVVILTFISSVISVFVAVIMVLFVKDKLFGRIFGQEIVLIIINAFLFIWIIYKGKCFRIEHCKYALVLALPLIPHLLAGNLLGSSDKIIIQKICGTEDLAFYSLAFNCSLLAKVLWDSLNQAMAPWLYDNIKAKKYNEIKKVSKIYLAVFLIVAIGIMLFVPEVVYIFGGQKYALAKYVMPPMIMGACFQFSYSMYVNIEFYLRKTGYIAIGTIGASLLNIVLNYALVERFGYVAAAYTTMFSYGVLMVFHYLLVRKLNMTSLYDNRFNFRILTVMCGITILIEFIYNSNVIRILALLLYLVCVLFLCASNRKTLTVILKSIIRREKEHE